MKLTATQIQDNYNKFIDRINKIFKTRSEQIIAMYDDLGERVLFAPASSFAHFHNAFPGGYIDHILRVMDMSMILHKQWQGVGLKSDNYTLEELMFAAMHHDLGKLGMPIPGGDGYVLNKSEWHRKNQGKEFEVNENIPHALIQDRSIFLLQHYGIKMSWNEYLAIRIHDGVYDDANKNYYLTFNVNSKLRNNMPLILHHADMMAARFEFERWALENNTFNMENIEMNDFSKKISSVDLESKIKSKKDKLNETMATTFNDIFKED